MTYTALFPMIVEEILSLNALSHHHIKKTLITIHDIKNNAVTTDSLKVFPCAVYLRFLNRTQLHRGHRALGFSCKINMLYLSLIESNCPVRIIISYRCRNIESIRQISKYLHTVILIQNGISNVLDNGCCLFLINECNCLDNELFQDYL